MPPTHPTKICSSSFLDVLTEQGYRYRYVARYARSDIGPLLVPRRGVDTTKRALDTPVGLDHSDHEGHL